MAGMGPACRLPVDGPVRQLLFEPGPVQTTLPYSAVKQMIRDGRVASADLQANAIIVATGDWGTEGTEVFRAITPPQGDPDLLPLLEANGTSDAPCR